MNQQSATVKVRIRNIDEVLDALRATSKFKRIFFPQSWKLRGFKPRWGMISTHLRHVLDREVFNASP